MRQAVAAEYARLEALARQRATAESTLAALLTQQPRQVPPAEPPAAAEEVAAPMSSPPLTVTSSPPPPAAAVRQPPRSRAEARPEGRAEGRAEGRVQLHYLAGSEVARQAAEDAAAVLRDAGVEGVDLRAAPDVPEHRLVRYHRAGDAGMAARLAGRLGRGWALQDGRGFDPGGTSRGLEIWLPDR